MSMIFSKKSNFVLICFTIICTTAQAQISRDTWTIGGSLDLAVNWGSSSSISQFQMQPKVGYFPLKHFQVGGMALIDYQKTMMPNEATLQTGFGPFLRYYIKTPRKISPYINTELIFTSSQTFYNENNSFSKPKLTLIRPGLGLAIFLTPHIALENQVTFQYATSPNGGIAQSIIQFSVGLQAHFYQKEEK